MKKKNQKIKLFLLLFLVTFTSLAQSETSQIITDSTIVVGVILDDCYLIKSIELSRYHSEIKIKRGTAVIISDAQRWENPYSNELQGYYEILYNNKTYYIENDKINVNELYYPQLLSMDYFVKVNFKENARKTAKLIFEDELLKALTFIKKCELKGLVILDWSFYDESEYTNGTSVQISIFNPTKKKIKYIWLTFIGYNAVDDVIIDRVKGTSKITMKGIGPINADETGAYKFDYVWHTDLVETMKIFQVKIQYMDGSFKTIINPKEIILDKQLYEVLLVKDVEDENVEIEVNPEINEDFLLGKWSDENSVFSFSKSGDFTQKFNDGNEIITKWKLVDNKLFVGIESNLVSYNIINKDFNYLRYNTSKNDTIFNAYRISD